VPTAGSEAGVDADAFRPTSARFGATVAMVLRCRACGHAAVSELPSMDAVAEAYADAEDPVSVREEAGQTETARRALAHIEAFVRPGRVVDLGCWTGSFLVAARERGWDPVGVEPSVWASGRARERSLDVRTSTIEAHGLPLRSARLVVLCDVLEHLLDPGAALASAAELLEPGGSLYLTVPDAGSGLARVMGRRWWSVLPMHLQYFTRSSLDELLRRNGFRIESMTTHAKVFTARYYAERLGGYAAPLERAAVGLAQRLAVDGRLVAPDLRDRVAVLATLDAEHGDADAFTRHRADVGRAFSGSDAQDIKRLYRRLGAYLEQQVASTNGTAPVLSAPETAPVVASLVPAGARMVLDAGCGPNPATALKISGPGRAVVALDIGDGMVRLARTVADDHGVVLLGVVGDVEHLPFRDGTFDAVICDDTIEHLPHDREGSAELARVTRGGGTIVVATPNRHSLLVLWDRFRDTLRGTQLPARGYYVAESHLREYTQAELIDVLSGTIAVHRAEVVGWDGTDRPRRVADALVRLPFLRRFSQMIVVAGTPIQPARSQRER
jgi:SAM-dependent methyltransferase